MSTQFLCRTTVTRGADVIGQIGIKPEGNKSADEYRFNPIDYVWLDADLLREIADKLDELNGVKE